MLVDFDDTKLFWETKEGMIFKQFLECEAMIEKFGLQKSSKIMWAIFLIYDWDSIFAHMTEDARIKEVEINILREKHGYWDKISDDTKPFIDKLNQVQDSTERRFIKTWEETIEKRTNFLKTVTYNIVSAKEIDRMIKETDSILAEKDKILSRLKSESALEVKGKQLLSLYAKGDIKPRNKK